MDNIVLMTPDVCMRFLVWAYYYNDIQPEPSRSFGTYCRFTPADAKRLDELKDMLFKCFEQSSVNNACQQFKLAKQRNEPCPFSEHELNAMFATPIPQ